MWDQRQRWVPWGASAGALATLFACASPAFAETAPGTAITNIAALSYQHGSRAETVASNERRIVVAERLDVALAAGPVAVGADGRVVVVAVLTNRGNGQEAFSLTATPSAGPERLIVLAIDRDGDGRYDPARDPALENGRTPVLAPGVAVTIFAILSAGTQGDVTIGAAAVTGTGVAGTTFPGMGDNGSDAVTGPTQANASVTVPLPALLDAPTLTKDAVVRAPDGSARAISGATITYTLTARFSALTAAARLTDPIPVGTAYAPASLTLDGVALSDADDGDAGRAGSGGIAVALGDQPAGSVRTIRFQVVIQ